jgi:preprotein translocase subunit SecA
MFFIITDFLGKVFAKVFGTANERAIKAIIPIVSRVNALEPQMMVLSDKELTDLTPRFKERLAKGETLDDILPEAFAAVREVARRNLKTADGVPMRHFDVQVIGAVVLHQGKIAEMQTGEGKTLVATMPAYLNSLEGRGVHVVTVNDYLAKRDAEWMGPVYQALGVSVGFIQSQMDTESRKKAYGCDITYGTNNEFGFDYLRDNMKLSLAERAQRELRYAIVDEVDSILIDEARTPLIISGMAEKSTDKYFEAERIASAGGPLAALDEIELKKEVQERMEKGWDKNAAREEVEKGYDVVFSEKEHTVVLTERGMEKVNSILGTDIYTSGEGDEATEQLGAKAIDWPHHIEQALRANYLYRKDRDYIVKDGLVIIVDEFTGRLMPGRVWSDGLHQAVEAKERLKIKEESQTLATITLQNYFRLYDKLSGMTGTAATEAAEFLKIYKLPVVSIPPNKPLHRTAAPDVIYKSHREKFAQILQEIVQVHEEGRPLLVGTRSIEISEMLSDMLRRRGIKHEVLNAKYHEREALIVAKAGQMGNVTIATNMAGRGTDIVLGSGVAELGGLHIVGTERHEARRIDNQLRGRAGRQGDPGSSIFFLSLEDDLMRMFTSERVRRVLEFAGMKEGVAISHPLITRAVEQAQKRVEERNFDIRKSLLDYDEVMDQQRRLVYSERQKILRGENLKENMILPWAREAINSLCQMHIGSRLSEEEHSPETLARVLTQKVGLKVPTSMLLGEGEEVADRIMEKFMEVCAQREQRFGSELMRKIENFLLLSAFDDRWKDHLYAMDQLRTGIQLRAYAQIDPKIAFKREGFEMFDEMIESLKEDVLRLILRVELKAEEAVVEDVWKVTGYTGTEWRTDRAMREAAQEAASVQSEALKPIEAESKTPRNAPCPCGSGKKYKKCCGMPK